MKIFKYQQFFLVLVGSFLMANTALAQLKPPPEFSVIDDAGVDMLSGFAKISLTDLNIGTGVSALSHTISTYENYFWGFRDSYDVEAGTAGSVTLFTLIDSTHRVATVGQKTQKFEGNIHTCPSTYSPKNNDGATLVESACGVFTYTAADGTIASINYNTGFRKVLYPNGFEVTVNKPNNGRVESVVTNTGLQLKYTYGANGFPSSITAINNAFEYCNPLSSTCALIQAWPKVTYSWPTSAAMFGDNGSLSEFTVTDAIGRVTSYKHKTFSMNVGGGTPFEPRLISVKDNTNTGYPYTKTFDYQNAFICYFDEPFWDCNKTRSNVVFKATIGGRVTTYDYRQPATPYRQAASSTGPRGTQNLLLINSGGSDSYLDNVNTPDGSATFNQDLIAHPNDRDLINHATYRGKSVDYFYDTRRNIIKETRSDGSSTQAKYPFDAAFPSGCNNLKTCNKPTWVKDAYGNQTDYTYYPEHGQIKSVTLPADKRGVRAQTRYKYTQLYATYKNASGALVQASSPVWMLTEENSCSEGAASGDNCATASKKVIKRYDYGTTGVPNNLWLRGVETESEGKILRTCYQYDPYGHVIAETSPNAHLSSCH